MILPANDSLWRAPSAETWTHNRDWQSYMPINLVETSRKMFRAEVLTFPVSSFGLLSLIGALISNICARERYSPEMAPVLDQDYSTKMERNLEAWETIWRRHPHAETIPSRYGDPLMTDCLYLFTSAQYLLHAGQELQVLKRIAKEPQCQLQLPSIRSVRKTLTIIEFAASSWLVRAKLGVMRLQRTAALDFVGYGPMTAYETGRPTLFTVSP